MAPPMRRTALLLRAAAVFALIPWLHATEPAANWWRNTETRLPLEQVLGPGAEVAWAIAGISAKEEPFTTATDSPKPSVLVYGAKPVTLEGRTAYGAVEINCRLQL